MKNNHQETLRISREVKFNLKISNEISFVNFHLTRPVVSLSASKTGLWGSADNFTS